MKSAFIPILLLLCINACKETTKKVQNNKPDIQFNHLKATNSELTFINAREDFGTVSNDTLLSGKFEFRNTGTDTLIIKNVIPDCSCTSFKLSKDHILPGDTSSIVLNMWTKHKFGKVEVYSTVEANTNTRLYSLEILADVK